ncbi:dihydroceramide fatty acyl 2-hydroxylase FAH2 [Scaptodrosophila lebanonensis]|uniref:Fatty acid 2-hydroxylase n=1 Tax=Drosophila lebanonensis TaxID=7225 RepID=A0A6J2TW59_DROLE|nr:dihydroceramide fatty acyl 2-hydroxylase FAH2 [Scaptodrosophila lebanonensis]
MDRDSNFSKKLIVKYRKEHYNLTEFIDKHPGGVIKGLRNADITARFSKAHPHSEAATYLMNEYKIYGKTQTHGRNEGKKKVDFSKSPQEINNQFSEDMEYLVDWSKAMLPQIANITKYYNDWVHKPVDRPLLLFDSWYLEMFTKTPWWLVPTFWIPVIANLLWIDFEKNSDSKFEIAYFFGNVFVGIFFWTLLEYALHRWIFHIKISCDSSAWLCTFHFLIHGLHHKVPFDPMRLVFPPLPGVILVNIIYFPISYVIPRPRVILVGALIGYLSYDMIHYYLHYGNPKAKHLYNMKRYHYQHHFVHQNLGYGISSTLWDVVFKTCINLRKLTYRLNWT